MSAEAARGLCSVCGRLHHLTRAGTLRSHGSSGGTRRGGRPLHCAGTGKPPKREAQ